MDGDEIIEHCLPFEDEEPCVLINDREETWEEYIHDLKEARQEVLIDIPGMIDEDEDKIEELIDTLNDISTRVAEVKKSKAKSEDEYVYIRIRTDRDVTVPRELKPFVKQSDYITMPVTIIDRRIIWYGQPICAADFLSEGEMIETEFFPCARFDGSHTAKILRLFLEM